MSYIPKPYVFDNCIQCAKSLKNYVSSNFRDLDQIFDSTLKVLEEWNDKRGRKALNKFQPETEKNKEHIKEAVDSISSSVDKCVSDLGAAKSAYNGCAQHLSTSSKMYSEWKGISL